MDQFKDYTKIAIHQIIQQFELDKRLFGSPKMSAIIEHSDDTFYTVKKMMAALNHQDFDWVLFDRCVDYCLQHDVYPNQYGFVDKLYQIPQTVQDFLNAMTVDEIKQLIRKKQLNVRLSDRKADVIEAIAGQYALSDFQLELEEQISDRQEKDAQRKLKHKCEMILHGIMHRAYILRSLDNAKMQADLFSHRFRLEYSPIDNELCEQILGCGYPSINQQNVATVALPPYYPGDAAYLDIKQTLKSRSAQSTPQPMYPDVPQQPERSYRAICSEIQERRQTEQLRQQIKNEQSPQFNLLEMLAWFVCLLWLGMGYVSFQNAYGWNKLTVLLGFSLPYAIYWFWRSRSKKARSKRDDERRNWRNHNNTGSRSD